MKDENHTQTLEETRDQNRVKKRHVKRHPKMKMTGKGMKRFAVPKSGGAGSGSAGKPRTTS